MKIVLVNADGNCESVEVKSEERWYKHPNTECMYKLCAWAGRLLPGLCGNRGISVYVEIPKPFWP